MSESEAQATLLDSLHNEENIRRRIRSNGLDQRELSIKKERLHKEYIELIGELNKAQTDTFLRNKALEDIQKKANK